MNHPAAAEDPARLTRAHVVPFGAFMAFMLVLQVVTAQIGWKHPDAPWWRQDPAHWLYPIQTITVLFLLARYWKYYDFRWSWRSSMAGVVLGVVGIGCWLLPTTLYDYLSLTENPTGILKWFGVAARTTGFDPGIFDQPAAWFLTVSLRFLRAVIAVALVEEIFWRGFLMRFVCDWEGDYWAQPFGRASWRSYLIITALFTAAHAPVDYAAAWVYGTLTYLLCVRSKSLGACVVMHATANLLMGGYIMAYGKYGLW